MTFARYKSDDGWQTSGIAGPILQYWPRDRVNVFAGAGLGFRRADGRRDSGLGLTLGAGVTALRRGRHNLQVGFDYAPVFVGRGATHNVGVTLGYQFKLRTAPASATVQP